MDEALVRYGAREYAKGFVGMSSEKIRDTFQYHFRGFLGAGMQAQEDSTIWHKIRMEEMQRVLCLTPRLVRIWKETSVEIPTIRERA